jgi:L-ascorbate metabolism protein UlaG (beta-lactamase superfamily)
MTLRIRNAMQNLRDERTRSSKQYRDGRFRNTSGLGPSLSSPPWGVMRDFFLTRGEREPKRPLPALDPRSSWRTTQDLPLRVTWLGHSTVLLEMDGKRILTDPVFGERASPVSFAGPKRFHPVPVRVENLPKLDLIVLSHDHYDHLCKDTFAQLAKRREPVVTSLGVGAALEAFGVDPACITELDWWESYERDGLKVTATPSQHFSGRGPTLTDRTLWSSWVMQTERARVFFSGDTGLTEEFREVGTKLGPFDLTMLEIGAFHEAWNAIHLGPANALKAFPMLGGGTLFPVHWGTFNLALHDWHEPGETLVALAGSESRVITPRIGQVFEPKRDEVADRWWREHVQRRA